MATQDIIDKNAMNHSTRPNAKNGRELRMRRSEHNQHQHIRQRINPLGHVSGWKKPPRYTEVKIFPPKRVVKVGKRRVNRVLSVGEHVTLKKCGWFGNSGHNR